MSRKLLITAFLAALALSGCKPSNKAAPAAWGYSGDGAPALWSTLNSDYATCGSGTSQSPIDIVTSGLTAGTHGAISVSYNKGELAETNNGHTLEVVYPSGSTMTVNGVTYNLLQFHFHAYSENTIDGVEAKMEAHFVHSTASGHETGGSLAVLALLVDEGTENASLKDVFDNFPPIEVADSTIVGKEVNAADILPTDLSYYQFTGSLTTPPCTEGVEWYVLKNRITVSAAQLAQFTVLMDGNHRPVQSLNGRTVTVN